MGRAKKFNEHPFPYHHELELEIETLTNLGSGLARAPLPGEPEARWVVMVPFTLPGERVRARVFRNHANYSEADLVEVLTRSPFRIEPRCPLAGRCGGCQYQHLAYIEQLVWKRRQTRELLQRLAGVEFPVSQVIGSPREFAYRTKITPHHKGFRVVDGAEPDAGTFPVGFLRQGTRFDIVDAPACPIATVAINRKLPELRGTLRRDAAEGKHPRAGTLLVRHAFATGEVTTDPNATLTETVDGVSFTFLARDFFQNNPFILPLFTRYTRSQAAGAGIKYLVDAYCGSGLFALTSARAFRRVAGIDVSESGIAFARRNAERGGAANVEFRQGDAPAIFAGLDFPPGETAVVIDPPRKGCDAGFLAQLFAFGPARVVYVSCEPSTQARDLKKFMEAGYRLEAVQPFDLFPQTRHIECVMTLARD
ncbi:MAG: class I SAM-dependent RNA methyltransferase [Opitutaceae bacterium]|jgi:23S rRNA (uracil1939-C5)-methyltransferase/tRNA (uracil-5-)-methyltransferase|nr:class I SAM-dependent RNA methyltransferase [Opitutaceae bacterium]